MKEVSGEGVDALMAGHEGRPPAEIERDLAIASLTQLRLLTAGPSASVFRAYQIATQRTVAVKVLHDELTSEVGQRFDRERAITGQLTGHTSVVPLLHTGTTADGEPYLVLPYYRRGSLADLMNRYGPLPWREATFLLKPVASTIAEVHLWGLVHRNLKPTNILLTDFLRPRVADFGMCLGSEQASTSATLVHGPFAPPEAATAGRTDPNMDVYGLAAILRSLLAGDTVPAVDADHRRSGTDTSESAIPTGRLGRPTTPELPGDDTPARILELIERSMSPDPAERPATVAAFIAELGQGDESTGLTSAVDGAADTSRPAPAGDHSADPVDTSRSAASPMSAGRDTPRDTSDDTTGTAPAAPEEARSGRRLSAAGQFAGGSVAEVAGHDIGGASGSHADVVAVASDRQRLQQARSGSPDIYYLLGLVALITTGIIVMVTSAILAFQ